MKKYIGLVFAFVCSSLLVFASCGSSSSLKGEFEESEYILSLGDNVDLLENFSCNGFAVGDVTINFSRDDLLKFDSESGKYLSIKSGEASAWAVVQGQIVATTKIFVKESFSAVQNISLSAGGNLTWQESYVIYSGIKVVAKNYLLSINDQEFTTNTNSYTLTESGVYNIKIKALASESDKIDESPFSNEQTFHFKVMPQLSNLSIQTFAEYNNHDIRVSWSRIERAFYRVKIDGFVIEDRLSQNEFTFNMKNYAGGDRALVEIEILDTLGENISQLTSFSVIKLHAPNLAYDVSDGEGKITFGNLIDASEYFARVVNIQTKEEHFLSASDFTKLEGKVNTFANGLDFGIYQITVQAKGQGFHANSNSSEGLTFVKLAKPNVDFKVEGDVLSLSNLEHSYVDRYKVRYAGKEQVWNVNEKAQLNLDISDLETGEFDLSVTALPKIVDGKVEGIEVVSISTTRIVNSDSFIDKFFILNEIKNIHHNFDKASNTSKISFLRPANSNKFTLSLGQDFTSDNFSLNGDTVEFVIADLARFESDNGEYNFTISAMRDDEHSTIVTKNKKLTILDTVKNSSEQENGYFKWNALENADGDKIEYRYEVYEADSDYNPTDNLVLSSTTSETTTEKLSYGFYFIKVYSISRDTNQYLDSNFENDNFFSQGFHVSEQISAPKVTFFEEGGVYKLRIEKAEHATRYDVFVDGVNNGNLINSTATTLIYQFQNQNFGIAKEYKVSVVASAPNNSVLHPQSDESIIKVTRLGAPSFDSKNIEVEFDKTGNKIHEKLSLSLTEHAEKIEIYNGSSLLGEEVFKDNVLDFISFKQNEFELQFKYIALAGSENEVYLDSLLASHTFKRMANPANITYNNGDITFTSASGGEVEKFIAFVTLVNDNPEQNYTVRHEYTGTNFDLSEFINDSQNDETFKSNYLQSSSIEVMIYAFATSNYKLPSDKGSTFAGNEKLSLQKLPKTVLSFDNSTQILSWTEVGAGNLPTKYDIYIDGELWKENYEASSINFNYENVDFLKKKKIYVVARNSSYLDSARSDEIEIVRLVGVESVNVSLTTQQKWILGFSLNDVSSVSQILINKQNIFVEGKGNYSLELDSLDSDIEIEVVAKSDTNVISAFARKYSFVNLDSVVIDAGIEDGNLVWNDIASDFLSSANKKPLTYTLKVFDKNGEICGVLSGLTELQIALNDIAERLDVENFGSGEYSIQISSSIEAYSLSQEGGFNKGYFGQAQSEKMKLSKLEKVDNISHRILQGTEKLEIDRILNANVLLYWDDKWFEYDDINFDVKIGDKLLSKISVESVSDDFALSLSNGIYQLVLKNRLFGEQTKISIVANSNKAISSDVFETEIKRLKNPSVNSLTISREGVLTFPFLEQSDFIIKYEIGNMVGEVKVTKEDNQTDVKLNLLDIFQDKSGKYSIEVLAFESQGLAISPSNKVGLSGTRLGAMESLFIDDYGRINIQASPELGTINVLAVLSDEQSVVFSLERSEGNFSITMNSLIEKFVEAYGSFSAGLKQMKFALMEEGSLPSPYTNIEFNYSEQTDNVSLARGRNEAENFIVIRNNSQTGENLTLTSFDFIISYFDLVEEMNDDETSYKLQNVITSKQYLSSAVAGFWIKVRGENGDVLYEYFDTVKPSIVADEDCEACYGIDLADLLEEVDYGKVSVKVSRVAKDDNEIYTQFATAEKNLNKLNSAEEFMFTSGQKATLKWTWQIKNANDSFTEESDLADKSGYYVFMKDSATGGEEAIFVSAESLDIFSKLIAEKSYNITVVAVSNNENVIASNRVSIPQDYVKKIKTPSKVTLEDGRIVFDKDEFDGSLANIDFVKTFIETRKVPNFEAEYVKKSFSDLFAFTAGDIEKQEVRLTLRNETTHQVYTTRVKAYQLIPDLSAVTYQTDEGTQANFLNFFMQKATATGTENSEPHIALRNMLKYITSNKDITSTASSNNGLADNKILFDDFGNEIPAGKYEISVSQFADVSLGGNGVESDSSKSHSVSVTAGTPYRLGKEGENYYAEMNLVNGHFDTENHNSQTLSYSYTMVLRSDENKTEHNFGKKTEHTFKIISSDEGQTWQLKYCYENGQIGSVSGGILSSTEGKVRVNLTTISRLSFINKKTYTVEIFAQGSNYAINGKSGKFTLEMLALTDFSFANGEFTWSASANAYSKVEAKRTGYILDTTEIPIVASEKLKLKLDNNGDYEYVLLSLMGSYGNDTISVDSEKYLIQNLTKLSEPSLSVSDNSLLISSSSNLSEYSYKITNNQAKKSQPEKFIKTVATSESKYIYHPGLLGLKDHDYKKTEQNADTFYVSLLGNSGNVISTKSSGTISGTNLTYQHVLSLESGDKFFLTSNEKEKQSRMLKSVSGEITLNAYGDIGWEDENLESLENNAKVYYKVIVNGYDNSNKLLATQEFITSEKQFDTSLITISASYFDFTIQKVAYKVSENKTDIQTVDGNYLRPDEVKFADGHSVFASEYKTLTTKFSRSTAVESITINDKTIEIIDGNKALGLESAKLLVYAKGFGTDSEYKLIGDSSDATTGSFKIDNSHDANSRKTIFTPNPNVFDGNNPFTILVYVVETNNLKSVGKTLTDVYKLPTVSANDYKISFVSADVVQDKTEYRYNLDLSEYFKNVSIMFSNSIYQIQVKFTSNGEEIEGKTLTFDSTNTVKEFIIGGENGLTSENLKLVFTVTKVKNESLKIITSDDSEVSLSSEIFEADISWDNENKIFTWELKNAEETNSVADSEDAEYHVSVTYSDNSVYSTVTKNKFFAPTKIGTIEKIEVRLRKDSSSLFSNAITLSNNEGFEFDLYKGGEGSEQNPYQIANASQFENILKRNEKGIYFLLVKDIVISDFVNGSDIEIVKPNLKASISGLKSGGGKYCLTIKPDMATISSGEVKEDFVSGNQTVSRSFTKHLSLFNQIEADAEIKDVEISFDVMLDASSAFDSNVMLAPLAFENFGNVDNCTVSNISVNGAVSTATHFAVAGLVSFNFGTISNCQNVVNGEILENLYQNKALHIYYAGFALCNGSRVKSGGKISHCYNSGDVTFVNPYTNASQRLAGIAVNNYGTIEECGNDGNISLTGQTNGVSTYISGITLKLSSSGAIRNCYNNNNFQNSLSGGSSDGSAGIVFLMQNGSLNGLIDTSSTLMINRGQSSSIANCYCKNPNYSGVSELSESTSISCADGHTLKVIKNGNVLIAQIV